ncbi:phosphotransferase family protein [Paractinoplanes hotanensis]|uniref:Phosphotransferase n=1 Tax=Paractinoplanes hotanensis TaxID=2906497 RepID=A0ABT0Y3Y6_9ACTN|nr:phosphotransferase [Actinoplanes hotanensis]MCM4080580.1 phosphotransferase [Actinoplanes hotanensis]
MRTISLPDVPYGSTAVRPGWSDLPESLREAVAARLDGPVVTVKPAGGGFTRAFAALVTTADGVTGFVKAAPRPDPTSDWYAREAFITSRLPAAVAAPRPLWTMVESDHFVLCLEPVDGHVPALPWSQPELRAALSAWSTAAEALAVPSRDLLEAGVPALADIVRGEMSWWTEIAAGREPMPRTAHGTVAPTRLAHLARLEQELPALVAGDALMHGDLRVDNVLIDRAGHALLCDWTWPCLGAPWFDTVTLLVTAFASGLDADGYLANWNAPAEGVDGALAALAGYWLVRADGGPSSASPHSRQHQRFSGEQALAWLADRRGW